MKRLIASLAGALFALSASATTLNPVQLLNPTGSSSGQAILSTGPSTAPAWGPVALSGITGTLAIANGGTGQTNAGSALTALGGAPIASPSFTGTPLITTTTETHRWAPHTNNTMFPGVATDYSDNVVTQSNSGSHSGTSSAAASIAATVTGSGVNGPSSADYGHYVSVIKNNFLTSGTLGEIDGISVVTRQGQDDTDGILINSGGVAGYMGMIEGVVNQFQATTGTILLGMDAQLGYIETGLTGTADSGGLALVATTGTLNNGLLIHSMSGAGWTNAITVQANSGGSNTFTVTPAGLVTANGGISGVTTGSAGASGTLGENLSSNTATTSMTAGTTANCTSKSLTAGDWLVWGSVQFNPAGTTTVSAIYAGINTTSATLPASGSQYNNLISTFTTGQAQILSTPMVIENLASTTTVFLVGNSSFGTSTMTCNGWINAVRYH